MSAMGPCKVSFMFVEYGLLKLLGTGLVSRAWVWGSDWMVVHRRGSRLFVLELHRVQPLKQTLVPCTPDLPNFCWKHQQEDGLV